MLEVKRSGHRILLPVWVFKNATSKYEIRENAESFIRKAYPNRRLVDLDGGHAICVVKTN